jgi:hypothetical protein
MKLLSNFKLDHLQRPGEILEDSLQGLKSHPPEENAKPKRMAPASEGVRYRPKSEAPRERLEGLEALRQRVGDLCPGDTCENDRCQDA